MVFREEESKEETGGEEERIGKTWKGRGMKERQGKDVGRTRKGCRKDRERTIGNGIGKRQREGRQKKNECSNERERRQ
jgi:hypothetical protein